MEGVVKPMPAGETGVVTPIPAGAFCNVVSQKGIKGSGLEVGDVILVAGSKVAPIKKDDPYLQRVYFLVLRYKDGEIEIPNGGNEYLRYLIDPRWLDQVDEVTQAMYEKEISEKYGDKLQ